MSTPHTSSAPTVLVNGAAGRLGRVAVAAFAQAGWQVIARVRRPGLVRWPAGVQELAVDAPPPAFQVLLHAANPPYTDWASKALPMARQAMDWAERTGALFLLPGNVYNFGSPMPERIQAGTPMQPSSRKGEIRAAIEQEMRGRAARGLRSAVLRAGDFFGGPGTGSWFDLVVVKSLRAGKLVYPGPLDVPHAWAYLPDLARGFVALAAQHPHLQGHHDLPFAGHTFTGRALLQGLQDAASELQLVPTGQRFRHGGMPWGLIKMLSPLVPTWREIREIAYLWHEPHALDDSALRTLLQQAGQTLHSTAADMALRAALRDQFKT
jgi:nucleoside-diphosphate-sugar epimerase